MERMGIDKNLPSTPWATRFRAKDLTYISGGQNRSMLAPLYPRAEDPVHYGEAVSRDWRDPVEMPASNSDRERLFWNEQMQLRLLRGIQTTEAAALNRRLRFTPGTGFLSGGNSRIDWGMDTSPAVARSGVAVPRADRERDLAIYERERIRVDETKWLPFFRKDRWFDWVETHGPNDDDNNDYNDYNNDYNNDNNDQRPGPSDGVWSIENPEIWNAMKVGLELANRVVEALIEDKHDGVSESAMAPGVLYEGP